MNNCPICKQKNVNYAFKNFDGTRYLSCLNCEFFFKEDKKKYLTNENAVENNIIKNNIPFDNFLNFLRTKNVNEKILFKQVISAKELIKSGKNFNFYLSRKSIYILLQTEMYGNINISVDQFGAIEVSAVKKIGTQFLISFIVPVFNEIRTCEAVISKLINMKFEGLAKEIIIVESNSTDGTREIIDSSFRGCVGVKVVYQSEPLGKGNAVREGIDAASGDFIAIQDADDEYDLEDYYNLLPHLMTGEETFILGNRHSESWWKMRKFEGEPFKALFLNLGQLFFTFLINVVTKANLKDPFTMFKIFRKDILSKVTLVSNRFDFDHEILIKLIKAGHIPKEIPVNYKSRSFSDGKKVNIISDPVSWIIAIFKYGICNK